MMNAGRDYVIVERAATAGVFFKSNPRHRKLISLNKRITVSDGGHRAQASVRPALPSKLLPT